MYPSYALVVVIVISGIAGPLNRDCQAGTPKKPVIGQRGEEPVLDGAPELIEVDPETPSAKPPVITAVALIPGGTLVATAGDDHQVRLWSTTNGRIIQTLEGHSDWVRTLAFSPDGKTLASAGDDRQVIIWQVASGKRSIALPPHPQPVYSLAYSPDGTMLAAVGFEHNVRIYDPQADRQVYELYGPCADLRSVVFSPNGKQLAVGGRNQGDCTINQFVNRTFAR